MRNLELKISLKSLRPLLANLPQIGAHKTGSMRQVDTYFNCTTGRFKLREINGVESMLIYYERPDTASHKISNYEIQGIEYEESGGIKDLLETAYGVKVVVKKRRDLWMFHDTRIHLDRVSELGYFLELETLIKHGTSAAKKEYEHLINVLKLDGYKQISMSYSDLLISKKKSC